MTSIPPNLARVPNLLASRLVLQNLTGTNIGLLRVQEQLSTLQRVNRPSDDPVASSLIGVLDSRLERADQLQRNMQHAGSVLDTVDQTLGEVSTLLTDAKSIASSQVGVGSDAATRASQATVIDSMLKALFETSNRAFGDTFLFGGERTATRPVTTFMQGYRYQGAGEGLYTDLGPGIDFPITIGAERAFGGLSARVEGSVDLNPALTAATFVRDLRGPAESRLPLGSLSIVVNDGVTDTTLTVDLGGAESVGDVLTAIESAIREADPAALTGAFGSALGVSGEQFAVNNIAAGYTITFADGPAGETARALGLDSFAFDAANATSTNTGVGLDPALTDRTTLADLGPATAIAYGDIVFSNGNATGTVTTSSTMTVGEFKEAVQRLNLGIRVEISEDGSALNVVNEVSGTRMSVGESGSTAATTLGIRTFSAQTLLSDFNDGRGVEIADGQIDPITGLPDPDRNVDFRITLSDGSTFDVDLTAADMVSVQGVLDRINADAAAAGFGAVFQAALNNQTNGIVLRDLSGGAGSMTVESLNGFAAEDLGLLDGTYDALAGEIQGEDRAQVRTSSVFSTLMELREALEGNDSRGITFAGERLEEDIERLAQARSLVGSRSSQVRDAEDRLVDTRVLDEETRSTLRDLDIAEASTRLSLLQTQLQAGLTSASLTSQLTLMDFLR